MRKRSKKSRTPTMLRIIERLGGFVSNIIAQMKRGVRRMNSLQDVIYRLEKVIQTGATDKDGKHPISAEFVLEELKSIADRPSGEWKRKIVDNGFNADWVCSECGYRVKTDFVDYHYCPHCGCRMKGADDETD